MVLWKQKMDAFLSSLPQLDIFTMKMCFGLQLRHAGLFSYLILPIGCIKLEGKISREEVARICVAALDSPYACDKTFEVKLFPHSLGIL